MLNLNQFKPTRDSIFLIFWEAFVSQISSDRKHSWVARKETVESIFKQAWDSGAGTVIGSFNDALSKRQLILDATVKHPSRMNKHG